MYYHLPVVEQLQICHYNCAIMILITYLCKILLCQWGTYRYFLVLYVPAHRNIWWDIFSPPGTQKTVLKLYHFTRMFSQNLIRIKLQKVKTMNLTWVSLYVYGYNSLHKYYDVMSRKVKVFYHLRKTGGIFHLTQIIYLIHPQSHTRHHCGNLL